VNLRPGRPALVSNPRVLKLDFKCILYRLIIIGDGCYNLALQNDSYPIVSRSKVNYLNSNRISKKNMILNSFIHGESGEVHTYDTFNTVSHLY
jgi:hypothetical protein